MEYSLYSLNQQADLNILTLQDLINKLNLIGFEVDDIFQEPLKANPNLQNTRLLIKIPANREDLLQEPLLIKELEVIFLIKILNLWNKVNKKYSFLLKHKYFQYSDYKSITIESNISNICVYQIALENIISQPSPIWIQQKILNAGLTVSDDHWTNLLNLIGIESGHSLHLSSFTEEDYFSKVKQIKNEFSIVLKEGKILTLPKGTIILENKDEKIQSILGYLDFFVNQATRVNTSNRLIVTSMFYDIHQNTLGLNTLNSKLSLRYLRKAFFEKLIFALERFLTLVELTSSAKILLNKYETKEHLIELKPLKFLKLTKKLLEQFLNTKDYQLDIFKKTGLNIICETPHSFYFEIPNHRNDLLREIDLIEEYTRCYGYANFKEIIPTKELLYSKKKLLNYNFIKQFFLNHGFNEIFTNSIQDQKKEGSQSVTISNPLNNELSILRENLFSKLIEVFELNKKLGFKNTSFF
jgi:phenylalanyl-tRNA synthetase beta chain